MVNDFSSNFHSAVLVTLTVLSPVIKQSWIFLLDLQMLVSSFKKKKKNQIPECNKFILDPSGCFIYHIRKFAKFSLS